MYCVSLRAAGFGQMARSWGARGCLSEELQNDCAPAVSRPPAGQGVHHSITCRSLVLETTPQVSTGGAWADLTCTDAGGAASTFVVLVACC